MQSRNDLKYSHQINNDAIAQFRCLLGNKNMNMMIEKEHSIRIFERLNVNCKLWTYYKVCVALFWAQWWWKTSPEVYPHIIVKTNNNYWELKSPGPVKTLAIVYETLDECQRLSDQHTCLSIQRSRDRSSRRTSDDIDGQSHRLTRGAVECELPVRAAPEYFPSV